ncbi:MAG: class I SAM-dependent methyltransferase [Chloroflexi bacterium]|nr:class I SAM-dependent methyltransferase [Chloroflexota bacterium]
MTKHNDGNRRVEDGRLVYFSKKTDPAFWDSQWQGLLNKETFAPYLRGFLSYFEIPFTRHLKKTDIILEAGCGTGQWVIALRKRGYNCIGTDYATQTLGFSKQLYDMPYFSGDITTLGMASESCDAVISLGVVEHRQEGPEPFISDMLRVLKPGGLLLISVPYFNDLRVWRANHGAYQDSISGLDFYQQAFTKNDISNILTKNGLKILEYYPYEHRKCLRQEIKLVTFFGPFLSKVFQKLSDYIPYVNSQLGHMLLVVAQK